MKKKQSEKARIASTKNLKKWEDKQAYLNRVSDNKEVFIAGFVIGSIGVLLISLIVISLC